MKEISSISCSELVLISPQAKAQSKTEAVDSHSTVDSRGSGTAARCDLQRLMLLIEHHPEAPDPLKAEGFIGTARIGSIRKEDGTTGSPGPFLKQAGSYHRSGESPAPELRRRPDSPYLHAVR